MKWKKAIIINSLDLVGFEDNIYCLVDNNDHVIGMVCKHIDNPNIFAIYQACPYVEPIIEAERFTNGAISCYRLREGDSNAV